MSVGDRFHFSVGTHRYVPARTMQRVRKICLALPEVTEKVAWGHPTFRVCDKIFATIGASEGVVTMTTKPPPGEQESLLA